ncbi:MAG: hypothetical protein H6799_01875 [Candidatus Nomurabacteria bacterium]|nr:MAG: hypothetical protein H6799_01875 [Candidatus Nomurabacteria bacterium]HRV76373.1 hypothetical protein [Candidatus Saccharimonadales bacterium]
MMFNKNNKKNTEVGEEVVFVSSRTRTSQKKKLSVSKENTTLNSLANTGVWRPNANINNLEQEKKKEVDREIKEKQKRKNRRIRARLTLKFLMVVLTVLVIYAIIGISSKRVHIILDNGAGTAYESDLKIDLNKDLDGGLFGYVRPAFLRYRSIEGSLIDNRDEVNIIKLHFNIFRMRTEAEIKTNSPLVKWIGTDGKPTYVNQKGRVFEPPPNFVAQFKPLEIGGSGLGAESGSKVLASSDKLSWVVGVIPVLREQGIDPIKINIDAQSFKDVEVLINGFETRVIFSIDEDVTRSGIAAARTIKFIQKGGVEVMKGVGYIDVRTPERVLYR